MGWRCVGRLAVLVALLGVGGYFTAGTLAGELHPALGWLALLPLLRCVQLFRPRGCFLAGALWGASIFVSAWTFKSAAVPQTLAALALLTLIPGCYAALGARLTRRVGYNPFVLAVGWMIAELALKPLALSHGLLAGTQGHGLLVQTVGGLFGYLLVAFVVAFGSAGLLSVLCRFRLSVAWPSPALLGLEAIHSVLWPVAVRPARVAVAHARPRAPPF